MKTNEKESGRARTRLLSKLATFAAATVMAAVFALIVGAFTGQALATPPGGSNAFAVGGITTVDGHVAFAAHRNPNGSYSGHVVQDSFGTSRSGPVDCVTVCGNPRDNPLARHTQR